MSLKIFLGLWGILFTVSTSVYAQQKIIHGLAVVDFDDNHPQGVLVTNSQTNISVETNISGSFSIKASVGDTLYFASDFLQSRKLPLKPIHFEYNPLVVHMNQEVIQLADIIVRPPLTGDLEKDIASVHKQEEIEKIYANLGIDIRILDMDPKERKEKIIPYWGLPTSINVGALVKTLNGYYRKMENLRQYEALDKELMAVKAYFGETYFEDIIGIQRHEAREFILYVYGQEKQIYALSFAQKDFLSLDQLLRSYAPKFKHRLKQRADSIQLNQL